MAIPEDILSYSNRLPEALGKVEAARVMTGTVPVSVSVQDVPPLARHGFNATRLKLQLRGGYFAAELDRVPASIGDA
jgi:hypothetical protein